MHVHITISMTLSQAYAFTWHSFEYIHWKFLKWTQAYVHTQKECKRLILHGEHGTAWWMNLHSTTTAMTMTIMTTTMNWMALISMQHYYLHSTRRIHSTLKSVGLYSIHSIFFNPMLDLCRTIFSSFAHLHSLFVTMHEWRARESKRRVYTRACTLNCIGSYRLRKQKSNVTMRYVTQIEHWHKHRHMHCLASMNGPFVFTFLVHFVRWYILFGQLSHQIPVYNHL